MGKKSLKFNKLPLKLNKKKIKRGIVPNFIHQCDSYLMHLVTIELHEKKISFYTVHDCIYFKERYEKLVLDSYKNSIIKFMQITNPLKVFMDSNKIESPTLQTWIINNQLAKENLLKNYTFSDFLIN